MNNADPGTQRAIDPNAPMHEGRDPQNGALPVPDPLPGLQAEFPSFRIWRETVHDGIRYIARSLRPGLNPHTVVTADPAELRASLAPSLTSRPGAARQDRA